MSDTKLHENETLIADEMNHLLKNFDPTDIEFRNEILEQEMTAVITQVHKNINLLFQNLKKVLHMMKTKIYL